MQANGIAVDFTKSITADHWAKKVESKKLSLPINFSDLKTAVTKLEKNQAVVLVIFAEQYSAELNDLLNCFKHNVGVVPTLQAIVCSDPSPVFMSAVFEFGIETFLSQENWPYELDAFCHQTAAILNDDKSTEVKAIELTRAIKFADQENIKMLTTHMSDSARFDYLAAFAHGKALEATGNFEEAVAALKHSIKMNKLFRAAITALGENLLITGQVDEAIGIFEKLDRSNPHDVGRKATLATAFDAKGDASKSQEYASAAEKISPQDSRVYEAKVQILLSSGKINDAFKMMDCISNAGPFFASKLNEMGIKLSQTGEGKSALALYEKAHRIVRPELRFKISLNAALACHRLNSPKMALQYLDKCEKEYGGSFEKLEKIRSVVMKNLNAA